MNLSDCLNWLTTKSNIYYLIDANKLCKLHSLGLFLSKILFDPFKILVAKFSNAFDYATTLAERGSWLQITIGSVPY